MLETVQMLETSAASESLAPFEISFASKFIKSSMLTSFPDFRQKYMKSVSQFFMRLRTLFAKDVRRYDPNLAETDPEKEALLWKPLEILYNFLEDITEYAEDNLYLDKPIEGAFPLFDVLKKI